MPFILMAEFTTPKKARIKGALLWARHLNQTCEVPLLRTDIARFFDVGCDSVYKIDSIDDNDENALRTRHHQGLETRGAKRKVDQADCEAMVRLYHEHPNEAAFMPWESQLIEATDKEATAPTIRKAMRLYYNYGRYIAAQAKFHAQRLELPVSPLPSIISRHGTSMIGSGCDSRTRFTSAGASTMDAPGSLGNGDTGIPLAFYKISLMRAKTGESLVYTAGRQ